MPGLFQAVVLDRYVNYEKVPDEMKPMSVLTCPPRPVCEPRNAHDYL
jgi:hypothetical protein